MADESANSMAASTDSLVVEAGVEAAAGAAAALAAHGVTSSIASIGLHLE